MSNSKLLATAFACNLRKLLVEKGLLLSKAIAKPVQPASVSVQSLASGQCSARVENQLLRSPVQLVTPR